MIKISKKLKVDVSTLSKTLKYVVKTIIYTNKLKKTMKRIRN